MTDMYDRVMILSGIVVEDLILQIVDRIASLYKVRVFTWMHDRPS